MTDTAIHDGKSDVESSEQSRHKVACALWLGTTALLGGAFRYPILLSLHLFQPESRNPTADAVRDETLMVGMLSASVVLIAVVATFLLLQVGLFRWVLRRTRSYKFWSAAAAAFILGVLFVGPLLWSV